MTYDLLRMTSLAVGSAAAAFIWFLLDVITKERDDFGRDSFERGRRTQLRAGSRIYRWFEPLLEDLEQLGLLGDPEKLELLEYHLALSEEPLPWKGSEYAAAKLIESFFAAGVGLLFVGYAAGMGYGIGCAAFLLWFNQHSAKSSVAARGSKRLKQFRNRLPYSVDLMALTMEAGANFLESVETVARENAENPLGKEFRTVLLEIDHGRSKREALLRLSDRVRLDDLKELIFAVVSGEELGTPLSEIFRTQSDQMMLKRAQWAEKESGEAQVNIVFPGILTMIACLLIVVTPFILRALGASQDV